METVEHAKRRGMREGGGEVNTVQYDGNQKLDISLSLLYCRCL